MTGQKASENKKRSDDFGYGRIVELVDLDPHHICPCKGCTKTIRYCIELEEPINDSLSVFVCEEHLKEMEEKVFIPFKEDMN